MKSILGWCWQHWIEIARAIGEFQSRLLLTLFYFTVLVPFGIVARTFADPLRTRRRTPASGWVARDTRADEHASRQQF